MYYTKILFRVLKDFKKNIGKLKYYTLFLLSLSSTLIASSSPLFSTKAISYIEKIIKKEEVLVKNIIIFFIIWIIFLLIKTFLRFLNLYIREKLAEEYAINEYKKNTKSLFYMTQKDFLNKKSGKVYSIINRGIESLKGIIYNFINNFARVPGIIYITIILFSINIKMAIASIILLPIIGILGYITSVKTRESQITKNQKYDLFFSILLDYIKNLSQIKIFNFEKESSEFLQKEIEIGNNARYNFNKAWIFSNMVNELINYLSYFLVLGTGIFLVYTGEIQSFATIFLFYSYLHYLNSTTCVMFFSLRGLQEKLESVNDYYKEIESIEEDEDLPNSKPLKNVIGKLHFDNVSFSYGKNKNLLDKLNFKINPGEKIAIVGNTGGGKSTIVSLIVRFFEVSSGEILIDNKNIQNFTKSSLRKNIGIVMQDNSLFNTTIEENLKFAKLDATEKEMIEALKKANADFVFDTPDGIKSEIGERGLKLSGGEKQRLCIARVFLKDPKILILDEATSALDNKTEKQIQKTLDELMIGKTTIIIAHRLSTIKNVDKIIVLDKGRIIETGKYDELIALKGKFYELANEKKEH